MPRKNSGTATIKEVAQKAGVGTMTVSRVLNTPHCVSEKRRERVYQAIAELEYVPNHAASSLASAYTSPVAVVIPLNIQENYHATLVEIVNEANLEGGAPLLYISTLENREQQLRAIAVRHKKTIVINDDATMFDALKKDNIFCAYVSESLI